MAFDQTTRNRLARFVGDARALLTEECTRQLQLEYGMDPASGEVTELDKLSRLTDAERETAKLLRETLAHYETSVTGRGAKVRQEAIERIVREQAFTVLNRVCALRMAEARGQLIESVARGYQSKGFQLYAHLAGPALGETGDAYRCYLFSLFDEFAIDLPVLFDRFSPQGRLFPRETPLLALLDLVNHPDIESLWAEDETIGWIYQYFNSREERKAMRDASQAPRNSRELAVRNQFFTPRYVVEFLTDNTLGRIWYEMTQGETSLKESCRYLVRRPNEVFLAAGVKAPTQQDSPEILSQEELLKQPVYIPHRPLKDPRAMTMLDPACGSMHFGLYAFDLFERIYEEAWELEVERSPKEFERAPMDAPLHEAYPDKEAFLRDVPRLIVEHNIHGIDIDPRAVQIAGLSLWLRAQKSWREQSLKPQERPQIRRSNVVCAEPMPGDQDLLEEFIAHQLSGNAEDKVVAWMLRKVFDAMTLAGEAGSLLKIEDEISAIVAEAKRQWRAGPKLAQGSFFADDAERITQRALDLDASGITDATFWTRAEERIDAALKDYAAFAEGEGAYRRRLFAGDAARGFAFIDLCRKRYDVVLMNPPFGEITELGKEYMKSFYPISKSDLFAIFIEEMLKRSLVTGLIGAITSRTGFFLSSFETWRDVILGKCSQVQIMIDLGSGVLDSAAVETAAYAISHQSASNNIVINLDNVKVEDKPEKLEYHLKTGLSSTDVHITATTDIETVPGYRFVYWISSGLRKLFGTLPSLKAAGYSACVGLQTNDDFRFVRTSWEIPRHNLLTGKRWATFYKGGEYSPCFDDIHLVVDWEDSGRQIKEYTIVLGSSPSRRVVNEQFYFKAGLAYVNISSIGFSCQPMPEGVIFSIQGQYLGPKKIRNLFDLFSSSTIGAMLDIINPGRHYQAGQVQLVPIPQDHNWNSSSYALRVNEIKRRQARLCEDTRGFCCPPQPRNLERLKELAIELWSKLEKDKEEVRYYFKQLDSLAYNRYQLDQESIDFVVDATLKARQSTGTHQITSLIQVQSLESCTRWVSESVTAYSIGASLGRWDIRYATCEHTPPELPDPFVPLPTCPPGMLQNEQGLPAAPADVPTSYPLRISWPGILVDDEGHPEDIEGRVREAIQIIWGERAEAIEQEACEILGVRALRDYFRKPALFFADHLQRYSKSRRQAPIYWPLSTPSGSYTLWLYYHRLTDQTLYSCVNDFVEPKLAQVSEQAAALRRKSGRTGKEEKDLERLTDLEQELRDFRAELLRAAAFWKPNLNDGVQITAALLWKLFQHKPWQKRLRETWEKLEAGEYDWAHLAYSIWPERVRAKCRSDKSLAIAHDLEVLYVEPPASVKKGRGKKAVEAEVMFDED